MKVCFAVVIISRRKKWFSTDEYVSIISQNAQIGINIHVLALSHCGAICFFICFVEHYVCVQNCTWFKCVIRKYLRTLLPSPVPVSLTAHVRHRNPNPATSWHSNIAPKTSLQYCEGETVVNSILYIFMSVSSMLYALNNYFFHTVLTL